MRDDDHQQGIWNQTMRNRTTLLAIVLLLPCPLSVGYALAQSPSPGKPAGKPNVVFILADDLGYGDLRCYGHPYARTPDLDRLASEGTRFTQIHVTGITCCPSRTGFMTGKFPATFREYPAGAGFGKRVTVTELLKKEGYRTGHFGKWHMGPKQTAGTYGIDSINAEDEDGGPRRRQDPRGRDAGIFDDAISFIEKNKAGPFYVNVWGHITHFPVNPVQAVVDRFRPVTVKESDFSPYMQEKFAIVRKSGGDVNDAMRLYLSEVQALDECVGRLLKRLDALGLRDNTIVVFSSDHGPAPVELPRKAQNLSPEEKQKRIELQRNMVGYAGGLRGGKHGMYEGGVRVPFIIRWPGHVPADRVDSSSVISGIDWLPTLCAITGAKIDPGDFDGEDVSGIWLGKARDRTRPLFWKTSNVRSEIAIRDGKWKLLTPGRKRAETELYDLSTDPGESTNLVEKHPEVVKTLKAKIDRWNATLPGDYIKANDND
jgi:N-acetylgalactosamine-6-sulfatase